MYFERLAELSMCMFLWEGLPKSIDKRFLELTLFFDGQALFFYDEVMGYLCLQCITNGPLSVNRIPINRRAFAINGYTRNLNEDNSVIIFNNYLHTNSILPVTRYAKKLYNIDRTIDVNINALKTPILIQGTEQQRLSLVNVYKEYDGNAPVIFGDRSLDINSLRVLKTDAPIIAPQLHNLKQSIWNEALTQIGIVNIDNNNRERLVQSEVINGNGDTYASRNSRLKARQEACEQINSMFGLNISVKYDDRYIEDQLRLMNNIIGNVDYMNEEDIVIEKGGEDNE